jgi:galactitol-specific phosphotransferase system IIB component
MEKEKILEIANDVKNKSNKDLFIAVNDLNEEFEKTKTLIINLTRHLESVEDLYNKINVEIEQRVKK